MNILNYTFKIPELVVEDGELIEMGEVNESYTFTLLYKGVDLYEKLTGRVLLSDLTKSKDGINIDYGIIKDIARASYVKIDGDAFHQNMITADEFSKTKAYSRIGSDTEFMNKLLEMVMNCCVPKSNQTKEFVSQKK